MSYVCTQLSEPDLNNVQTCVIWSEQNNFALPQLTAQHAYEIGLAIFTVCVVAFCYKLLATLIKTFIK